MARRNDHSREQLRDLAIQAVLNLVDHDAFVSVTARSVTQDMGYTVGTLYLVFRNFDDLLLQVNAELLKRLHSDMQFAVKMKWIHKPRSLHWQSATFPWQSNILDAGNCYL
ncbi:MAG: TetR/AcrR family transcriptional regulator, partial [Gammaproteobacteria bacterium]|nr:TetR/AcrR family transcriptional regulator [Gammaproteobacteria bacterium]